MFALVCIVVPPFLALAIPASILYCALLSYYRRTSRAMQRIEAVQRAPAYALLSEALAGVAPLRSAHLIRKYVKAMARRADRRSAVLYHLMSANCWLGLSMEALSSAIVAFAAFASVGFAISGSLTAGAAGLVVTNAIMVTGPSRRRRSDGDAARGGNERRRAHSRRERGGDAGGADTSSHGRFF